MPDEKKIFEKRIPYTIVRNEVFDEVMPKLSLPAWKVLCAIIRATMGWHKTEDRLSYSQLLRRTGLASPSSVSRAVAELEEGEYIRTVREAHSTNIYSLNEDYILILGGTTLDVVPNEEGTIPDVVGVLHEVETQKKGLKERATTPKSSRTKRRKRDPLLDHEAVKGYRELARLRVPTALRSDWIACAEEVGTEHLLGIVKQWIGKGHRPQNVLDMMDVARNGWNYGPHKQADDDPLGFNADAERIQAEYEAGIR